MIKDLLSFLKRSQNGTEDHRTEHLDHKTEHFYKMNILHFSLCQVVIPLLFWGGGLNHNQDGGGMGFFFHRYLEMEICRHITKGHI